MTTHHLTRPGTAIGTIGLRCFLLVVLVGCHVGTPGFGEDGGADSDASDDGTSHGSATGETRPEALGPGPRVHGATHRTAKPAVMRIGGSTTVVCRASSPNGK